MEKYIKLEDLNNLLSTMYNEPGYMHTGETFYAGICAVQDAIRDLPTVRLNLDSPIVAQWKTREARNDYLWVECSNCGFMVENYKAVRCKSSDIDVVAYKMNACPKCAARMIFQKEDK